MQRARVDGAVRTVADEVTAEMAKPWAMAVRSASVSRLDDFTDALDTAVAGTDLGVSKDPAWWSAVRVLQWMLFFTALAGGLWLAALAFFAYLRLPEPGSVDWHGFPVPTLLLIGGVAAGLIVAAVSRFAARISARRRAQRSGARLRAAIARVTDSYVVTPMQAEIDAYLQMPRRACRRTQALTQLSSTLAVFPPSDRAGRPLRRVGRLEPERRRLRRHGRLRVHLAKRAQSAR
ncbi:MAG: hypothetical protein WKF73_08170 [Nocardioidaceae bacterium]